MKWWRRNGFVILICVCCNWWWIWCWWCRARMEAILNRVLFFPHCLTNVIGKLTLLSWTSPIQFALERCFLHFLDVFIGVVLYQDLTMSFRTCTVFIVVELWVWNCLIIGHMWVLLVVSLQLEIFIMVILSFELFFNFFLNFSLLGSSVLKTSYGWLKEHQTHLPALA